MIKSKKLIFGVIGVVVAVVLSLVNDMIPYMFYDVVVYGLAGVFIGFVADKCHEKKLEIQAGKEFKLLPSWAVYLSVLGVMLILAYFVWLASIL